ncbi:SRPBCC family protein [Saccharomonospora xinjiangensis]|uniref:SRPBCC family protein n=1 Tax=Saccharomonospora xinjiangensis TaxID=75294 RepID=UPI00107004F0|nr:SRPBCC family protein [Saccharomonospora xinjiangensis]QBQ59092.1 Polyketide cyclase / dehydrase and lipid transport [Saccharomonospora xinjiangensis]
MSDLALSVEVAAPAGTTWLALTDWERQSEWILGTTVRVVSGNGRSVGSRLEAFTGVGGVGVTDAMEITNWEPPVRCTVRHLGKVVRGTGTFHVHGKGPTRCVFTWAEEFTPPFGPVGRLGWLLVRPAFAVALRRSMRTFATFAENYEVGG